MRKKNLHKAQNKKEAHGNKEVVIVKVGSKINGMRGEWKRFVSK